MVLLLVLLVVVVQHAVVEDVHVDNERHSCFLMGDGSGGNDNRIYMYTAGILWVYIVYSMQHAACTVCVFW